MLGNNVHVIAVIPSYSTQTVTPNAKYTELVGKLLIPVNTQFLFLSTRPAVLAVAAGAFTTGAFL